MRVIAGTYQRMKLQAPDDYQIRPTMDRAKEGLFNIINMDIIQTDFLDLFSGTGSIGIEAISRGANNVCFVDNSPKAIKLINLNSQKITEDFQIINQDIKSFLKMTSMTWDYIFMDPPYTLEVEEIEELIDVIVKRQLLNPGGQIIVEYPKEVLFNEVNLIKSRKYGKSVFTFFEEHK